MKLTEFLKLSGVKKPTWQLEAEPTFAVGDEVEAVEDTGIDAGKRGRVLTIDDGWAQIRTKQKEMLWFPNPKLRPVE